MTTSSKKTRKRDYVAEPMIGPLLRMPLQSIRAHMLERVHAAGYDDIAAAHFNILQHPTPDGLRPSEIAARGQMTKQAANRLIRHLEQQGYLALEPDPTDQRARVVRLTRRGWSLIDQIRKAVGEIEADWETRLGRKRFATLRAILTELAETGRS